MAALSSETIPAACVAVNGRGVLIEGHDREDRTSLALRLIDRGAMLVADEQALCTRRAGALHAAALPGVAGKIELRGLDPLSLPHQLDAPVSLVVVVLEAGPRLPEDKRTRSIAGVELPVLALAAGDPAAPIKVEIALGAFPR
jgi:serine kinase of HPr protein (carbohydrate metabolism regulator)